MSESKTTATPLYFAHDACGGETEILPTEAEALAFAKEAVNAATQTAQDDGEWEEGASEIYVGVVTHRARLKECSDGSYNMTFGPVTTPERPSPSLSSAGEVEMAAALRRLLTELAWDAAGQCRAENGHINDALHNGLRKSVDEAVNAVLALAAARTVQQPAAVREALEMALQVGDQCSRGYLAKVHAKCRDALAALSSAGEQGWRPISEAPKDGAEVLIWNDGIFVARWTHGYDNIRQEPWECFVDDGFNKHTQATHFRPLPAPPASTDGEG